MLQENPVIVRYIYRKDVSSYNIPFRVYMGNDIRVSFASGKDRETILSFGTDYSVSISDSGTASLQLTVHGHSQIPNGVVIAITSNIPLTQELNIASTTIIDTVALETELDRQVQMLQQLQGELDRAVKVPAASTQSGEEFSQQIFDAAADAANSAQAAAASAAEARKTAAETAEIKAGALRDLRDEGDAQAERLDRIGNEFILTVNREADRAHDEADRAKAEADRAAITATLAVSTHNFDVTWTLEEDIPAGGDLMLPAGNLYFPGRNMLRLSFEGILCYPGVHYEEVPLTHCEPGDDTPGYVDSCPVPEIEEDPDLPTGRIRLLFDAKAGTVFNAWIVASNVARHLEETEQKAAESAEKATAEAERAQEQADRAQSEADRAEAEANRAQEAADEATRQATISCNCAQEATENADRADDAASDAEQAAQLAKHFACIAGTGGIVSLYEEDDVFSMPTGMYIINPPPEDALCAQKIISVDSFEQVPDYDTFWIIAGKMQCQPCLPPDNPDNPDNPGKPDEPDNPSQPGPSYGTLCGKRRKLLQ